VSGEDERTERDAAEQEAAGLDSLAAVPDEVLADQVAERGLCLWDITYGDPPIWDGDGPPDRELAARLCANCPVRRECLEFELRLGGAHTVGVWGGLSEDDRRALHAVWQARAARYAHRDKTDDATDEGGEEPCTD
jgi:WhiB family transcriptional regulator, redox-sensing transcriptional regulator